MIFIEWFLIIIGLIWILGAVVQDIRKREVGNWWNFSLIALSLSYWAFLSVLSQDYRYILFGIAGFAVFFIIANLFYYSRVFAGGDAKLLMGLGPVLIFSFSWLEVFKFWGYFLILFLFLGGIYGLLYSFVLVYRNLEDFKKRIRYFGKKFRKLFFFSLIIGVCSLIIVLVLKQHILALFSLIILLTPILLVYAKGVEESCMIKKKNPQELTEGDWLYEKVKIGKRIIKPDWEGLSEKELKILKKYKGKVKIKEGIPFTPAFLFAFIALLLVLIRF